MKKRDLQREKLECIKRAVLQSGKMSDAEIEKIVGAPQLFERVRNEIQAEQSRRSSKSKNTFGLPAFQFWNRRAAGLSFAAFAFLILTAIFFLNFTARETARETVAEEVKPEILPELKQPERASQNSELSGRKSPPRQFAAIKKVKESKSISTTAAKSIRKSKLSPRKFENYVEEPFVALTYAGNLRDEESQIIRVEMTPARLLALGVAVQTENEADKIKTDLLVGSDGVARAIRLVK